jgi:predicted small lipoprotein YifL
MIRSTITVTALALLAGCHAQPTYLPNGDLAPATAKDYEKDGIYDVSFNAIKNNPTPELSGMNERDVDMQRNLAVNANQTTRMFWSDLGRMWLADEPSPLSPYPTINTTGNP